LTDRRASSTPFRAWAPGRHGGWTLQTDVASRSDRGLPAVPHITRPALSDVGVQLNAAGQVELELKTPRRDGTTHRVKSPLEFMQRLAALAPRPRLHLIRFHGVLAPNAKLRAMVAPQGAPVREELACEAAVPRCEV